MTFLGPAEIRRLAAEIGLRPTKKLGQNFVHDANTVRRIVESAQLRADRADEVVLEVGPGLGSLTLGLLPAARQVVAVEVDEQLAARLPRTAAAHVPEQASRLRVLHRDALTLQRSDLVGDPDSEAAGVPTALVANLPYNVAVPVLLHLLVAIPELEHGVIMVQAEVADRLVAEPGSRTYGAPSAKLAWFAHARRAGAVPRSVFWPVPNVDSALVAFRRHTQRFDRGQVQQDSEQLAGQEVGSKATQSSSASLPDRKAVFAVIDQAFAQRRKTLRSALAGWAGSAARAEQFLTAAGIDPRARGEQLDIAAFTRLASEAHGLLHPAEM